MSNTPTDQTELFFTLPREMQFAIVERTLSTGGKENLGTLLQIRPFSSLVTDFCQKALGQARQMQDAEPSLANCLVTLPSNDVSPNEDPDEDPVRRYMNPCRTYEKDLEKPLPFLPCTQKDFQEIKSAIKSTKIELEAIRQIRPMLAAMLHTQLYNLANLPENPSEIRVWLNNPENQRFLASITNLNFAHTGITHLTREIEKFVNLKGLTFIEGALEFLPDTIGNLTKLECLCINSTKLNSLPDTMDRLTNLKILAIQFNSELESLPEDAMRLFRDTPGFVLINEGNSKLRRDGHV